MCVFCFDRAALAGAGVNDTRDGEAVELVETFLRRTRVCAATSASAIIPS